MYILAIIGCHALFPMRGCGCACVEGIKVCANQDYVKRTKKKRITRALKLEFTLNIGG